jgi:hypothetical protein
LPSKAYSFGVTEEKIGAEPDRTVLIIQNIHATQNLFVSDDSGQALSDGVRITPNGSFDCKKALGMEPEKAWYVVASGAGTTTRIYTDYGDYPKVISEHPHEHEHPPTPERAPI